MVADPVPTTLEVIADAASLPAATKDQLRVVVRALDQAGNILPFLNDPVHVELSGPAKLLGPQTIVLVGGTTGFWLESTGQTGAIALAVSSPRFETQRLSLSAV
jgi:beta-galactosidase